MSEFYYPNLLQASSPLKKVFSITIGFVADPQTITKNGYQSSHFHESFPEKAMFILFHDNSLVLVVEFPLHDPPVPFRGRRP
jgi:hypothetical protein